jgi:thiol-disulfide isomerase/thioredoxin
LKVPACACLLLFTLTLGAPAAGRQLESWKGGAAPPLVLKDLQGRTHRLSDYRGKLALINFWATWCEPCRDEMASIQVLQDKLAGQGLVVLAVNAGEFQARIEAYLKQSPLDMIVLRDPGSQTMKVWRVGGLPTSYVIAPNGRIRYRVSGEFDWSDEKVIGVLRSLAREQ